MLCVPIFVFVVCYDIVAALIFFFSEIMKISLLVFAFWAIDVVLIVAGPNPCGFVFLIHVLGIIIYICLNFFFSEIKFVQIICMYEP